MFSSNQTHMKDTSQINSRLFRWSEFPLTQVLCYSTDTSS